MEKRLPELLKRYVIVYAFELSTRIRICESQIYILFNRKSLQATNRLKKERSRRRSLNRTLLSLGYKPRNEYSDWISARYAEFLAVDSKLFLKKVKDLEQELAKIEKRSLALIHKDTRLELRVHEIVAKKASKTKFRISCKAA
jgi:hypothetical protein